MLKIVVYLLAVLPFSIGILSAQETEALPDSTAIDTTKTFESLEYHSFPLYVDQIEDTTSRGKAPTVALFKSMLIPGWGQISNRKYIKAGIIITLEATLIYNLVRFSKWTSDAEDAYKSAPEETKGQLFEKFRDYEDLRNLQGWYLGTVIFLSMFDAYVDAHLADFPKKNKGLAVELFPPDNKDLAIRLSYNF